MTSSIGWVGERPPLAQQAAVFVVGIVGVMFAGVGPLLLGGLEAARRLTAEQIGLSGTIELLAMGIGAGLASTLLGRIALRPIAVVCGIIVAVFNLLTTQVGGDALIVIRGLAGVPGGVMIWLVTGLVVRSSRPERYAGAYLTLQTLAQLLVVEAIATFVMVPFGVNGGFVCLAGLGLVAALVGLWMPAAFAPLSSSDEPSGLPDARGWVALAATLCFQAFILAAWIYVEPLARQAGHGVGTAALAISLSLGAQVVGGAAATWIAGRLGWASALIVSVSIMALLLGVFATLPSRGLFLAASGVFGFFWMFASPYLTPMAIDADPSRRAAMFGPGASLLGCGAGPLLASLVVSDVDVRGSLGLAAGIALICAGIVAYLRFTRHRIAVTC